MGAKKGRHQTTTSWKVDSDPSFSRPTVQSVEPAASGTRRRQLRKSTPTLFSPVFSLFSPRLDLASAMLMNRFESTVWFLVMFALNHANGMGYRSLCLG
jgi:hypothetical protein